MTPELEAALKATQRECDTVHAELLNRLGDIAADMGDDEMELGFRLMANNGLWPTYWELKEGEERGAYIRDGYGWDNHHSIEIYRHSHQTRKDVLGKHTPQTVVNYDTVHEAIEAMALELGRWHRKKRPTT